MGGGGVRGKARARARARAWDRAWDRDRDKAWAEARARAWARARVSVLGVMADHSMSRAVLTRQSSTMGRVNLG